MRFNFSIEFGALQILSFPLSRWGRCFHAIQFPRPYNIRVNSFHVRRVSKTPNACARVIFVSFNWNTLDWLTHQVSKWIRNLNKLGLKGELFQFSKYTNRFVRALYVWMPPLLPSLTIFALAPLYGDGVHMLFNARKHNHNNKISLPSILMVLHTFDNVSALNSWVNTEHTHTHFDFSASIQQTTCLCNLFGKSQLYKANADRVSSSLSCVHTAHVLINV